MKVIDICDLNKRLAENAARKEILRLAERQQLGLATKFDDLLGDGGPPNETADEVICAIKVWRFSFTRSLDQGSCPRH